MQDMEEAEQSNKKSFSYYLGNTLIIVSLAGILLLGYPFITMYFFPPKVQQVQTLQDQKKGFFITIPKIHAQAPVIPHVDPFNEASYHEALKHGVAQAEGTALPDQKGTVFIFAHSSGMPWEQLRYNTIFLRLGELKRGDPVMITYNGKTYTYIVADKKEVWPSEVSYLQSKKDNQLILQTCTPIGTSLKRLLIFAEKKA